MQALGQYLAVGEHEELHQVKGEGEPKVEPGVEDEVGDGEAVELARGQADLGDVADGPRVLVRAKLLRIESETIRGRKTDVKPLTMGIVKGSEACGEVRKEKISSPA